MSIDACGSRPCPGCFASGTDADGTAPCRVCAGTLWFPYPWELPEDEQCFGRAYFTSDESAVVTAAPTSFLAYIGYTAVFGCARTFESVRQHRLRCLAHPDRRPIWSERMLDIIDAAPSSRDAVNAIARTCGSMSPPASAIVRRWQRLHPSTGADTTT